MDTFLNMLNVKTLKTIAISTTLFMLAAYMYAYTNGAFLFDAAYICRGKERISFTGDKWAISFLGLLDAHVNEPWLAGIWTVLFMIVSVYLIVDILEIKSTGGIWLTAGLCSTQSSIICQQTYCGGQYTGEAALVLACLATWIFLKTKIRAILKCVLAAICIAISAGIYGAYISMVPSLMILSIMEDIIYKGKSARENWKKAFFSVGQFLVGMVLYYGILRLGLYFTGSQLQSYMNEDSLSSVQQVVDKHNYIAEAYVYIIKYYLGRLSVSGQLHYLPESLEKLAFFGFIIGICISLITLWRYREKIVQSIYNSILLLGLLLILPLSVNLIYVLASGSVHHLMIFTYVLPYVFFVKLTEMEIIEISDSKRYTAGYLLSALYKIVICFFVYYSIVMANATFAHLGQVYTSAQSIGTRFLSRIESCEGFDGTETVHLIGQSGIYYNEYFSTPVAQTEILNAYLGNAIPELGFGFEEKFLFNILGSKLNYDYDRSRSVDAFLEDLREEGVDEDTIKRIEQMPSFPYDGSVQKIGGDIYIMYTTDEMADEYIEKYKLYE